MTSKRACNLSVVYQQIHTLKPNRNNSRTHTKHQIRQIAESIKTFGFTNPVLIDKTGTIIAGHGRVEAAKLLGMTDVPTIQLENLTDEQLRAYVIADNRLAEKAGWDQSLLAIELQHLLDINIDFDVTVTGFEVPEIDLILEEAKKEQIQEDDFEIDEDLKTVTQPGDLWILNKHRVICGNALHETSFKILMSTRRAHVVFADPPYNVAVEGNVCGNGAIHHRDFAMGSGELSDAEFVAFLTTSLRLLFRHSLDDSVHFVCMDWRHVGELLAAGKQIYDDLLNLCVWVKNNGGLGSFYRSRHELVFVFKKGEKPHRNNIRLGQFGRNRTNVWEYANASTFSKQGEEGSLAALHPTVKPVALVADALLDCSVRGEIVLDPFLGSGTTLLASERVGRVCYGIEIDALYVDIAIRRWQRHTGDQAIHASTGKSFGDLAAIREVEHEKSSRYCPIRLCQTAGTYSICQREIGEPERQTKRIKKPWDIVEQNRFRAGQGNGKRYQPLNYKD